MFIESYDAKNVLNLKTKILKLPLCFQCFKTVLQQVHLEFMKNLWRDQRIGQTFKQLPNVEDDRNRKSAILITDFEIPYTHFLYNFSTMAPTFGMELEST